ncbi:MAG: hypothetical protein ACI9VN_002380 [Patescibacteria group bacterium]|jgi:hypothetical protein
MILDQKVKLLQAAFDTFTKLEMDALFRPLTIAFLKKHSELLEAEGLDLAIYVELGDKKSLTKAELTKLVSMPFLSKDMYEAWSAEIQPDAKKIWDTLIFEKQLHETDILDRFGLTVAVKKDRYWYGNLMDRLIPDFRIFQTEKVGSWNNTSLAIKLPFELRVQLKNYYTPPKEAEIVLYKEIPETEFLYEEGDRTILSEISRVFLYHEQGQIPVTGKNRPKFTSLGKMKKTLNIRTFFDQDEKDKKLRILRTNILSSLIVHSGSRTGSDWLKFLQEKVLSRALLNECDTAAVLLMDLKGMGHIDNHYLTGIEPYYFKFIKSIVENSSIDGAYHWIGFEEFYQSARFNLIPMEPIVSHFAGDKLYYDYDEMIEEGDFKYRETRHWIKEQKYHKAISIPYLKATIFMYAALGIFDLAYDRPDRTVVGKTCYSCYDGLRYFRLTKLGEYLFGLRDNYSVEELLEDKSITFSPDALTITVGSSDSSMAFTLKPYTRQLGPNRYATDSQIFLQGIHTRADLAQKVKMFREVTGATFPANWESFFDDLSMKVDPFEPLKEQMVLYKLPEANRALIQLIAQDGILKKFVLKAEGYHIIFPKSKMITFKKRLAEFGYLVT